MFGFELVVLGILIAVVGGAVHGRKRRHRLMIARETMPYPERPLLETDGDRDIDTRMRRHLQAEEEIEQQAVVIDSILARHIAVLTNRRVVLLLRDETKARSVRRDQIANVILYDQRMMFYAKGRRAELTVPPEAPGVSSANQEAFLVAVTRLFGRRELPMAVVRQSQ